MQHQTDNLRQPVLEKVTAFITRGTGATQEVLVFQHPSRSIQIPAGTVEEGEDVEAALWREVSEETGLTNLTLLARMGVETVVLPFDKRVLLRTVPMLSEPAADSSAVGMTLRRGLWVSEICARKTALHGIWSQVLFEEYEAQGANLVVSKVTTGWVPSDAVTTRVVRHFFHLEAPSFTPDRWRCRGEIDCEFALFWTPLAYDPGLVSGQAEWLGQFRDKLRREVSGSAGA